MSSLSVGEVLARVKLALDPARSVRPELSVSVGGGRFTVVTCVYLPSGSSVVEPVAGPFTLPELESYLAGVCHE